MKVSVLIPAYNESRRIPDAIKSTLCQAGADVEILIGVEDFDTQTISATQDASAGSKAVDIVRFAERESVCAKINRLLSVATGEIVVKMDADMAWGHEHCLSQLVQYYGDPRVGGVSLGGDRGLKGYEEIFQLVTDEQIRDRIVLERAKSFFARGENFIGRTVNSFRKTLLPVEGTPKFPIDIHSFRRNLVECVDPALVHDDLQYAYVVLSKGYKIIYGESVVLFHYGTPTGLRDLMRQKLKGLRGWEASEKVLEIRMGAYYRSLLAYLARNLLNFSLMDMLAGGVWLGVYAWSKVAFALGYGRGENAGWESPRR